MYTPARKPIIGHNPSRIIVGIVVAAIVLIVLLTLCYCNAQRKRRGRKVPIPVVRPPPGARPTNRPGVQPNMQSYSQPSNYPPSHAITPVSQLSHTSSNYLRPNVMSTGPPLPPPVPARPAAPTTPAPNAPTWPTVHDPFTNQQISSESAHMYQGSSSPEYHQPQLPPSVEPALPMPQRPLSPDATGVTEALPPYTETSEGFDLDEHQNEPQANVSLPFDPTRPELKVMPWSR